MLHCSQDRAPGSVSFELDVQHRMAEGQIEHFLKGWNPFARTGIESIHGAGLNADGLPVLLKPVQTVVTFLHSRLFFIGELGRSIRADILAEVTGAVEASGCLFHGFLDIEATGNFLKVGYAFPDRK